MLKKSAGIIVLKLKSYSKSENKNTGAPMMKVKDPMIILFILTMVTKF